MSSFTGVLRLDSHNTCDQTCYNCRLTPTYDGHICQCRPLIDVYSTFGYIANPTTLLAGVPNTWILETIDAFGNLRLTPNPTGTLVIVPPNPLPDYYVQIGLSEIGLAIDHACLGDTVLISGITSAYSYGAPIPLVPYANANLVNRWYAVALSPTDTDPAWYLQVIQTTLLTQNSRINVKYLYNAQPTDGTRQIVSLDSTDCITNTWDAVPTGLTSSLFLVPVKLQGSQCACTRQQCPNWDYVYDCAPQYCDNGGCVLPALRLQNRDVGANIRQSPNVADAHLRIARDLHRSLPHTTNMDRASLAWMQQNAGIVTSSGLQHSFEPTIMRERTRAPARSYRRVR